MGVVKSPGVVARGVLQIEAGYMHAHRDARTRQVFGETLVRGGIGGDTELRAIIPSYLHTVTSTSTVEGAGDAGVALKHRFRQAAGWMPGVSVTLSTTLPVGADGVGAGAAQPEGSLSAEWRLPRQVALVGTAGHREAVQSGDRFGQNTLGAAARADLTKAVNGQLEYSRVSSTREGAVSAGQVRATAAVRVSRDLQLDGWVGRITQPGAHAESEFGLGFTRRW